MSQSPVSLTNTSSGHALDGTFLLYDINATAQALKNHEWASLALIGVADTLDTAATISDPLGSLFAAGIGWVIDHFDPLKSWLDDLTGDAGAVDAFSGQWEGVAGKVETCVGELRARVHADLTDMEGDAIASYTAFIERLSKALEGVKEGADGMAGALRFASTLVEAVHGIVRDAIAQICGAALSWAAEEVFSLGLASGWVAEQVSTRVAAVSTRIGNTIRELISSCKALEALVNKLDSSVGAVRSALDHIHPDVARGKHNAPWLASHHAPTGGGGRHRGSIESVPTRIIKVGQVEVPRDAIGESAASGSNATKHKEEPTDHEPEHVR